MQTVHFLGNARNCYNRHFYPVRAWKKELLEAGIKTRFFPNPMMPGIKECDTLVVFADGYKDILPIKETNKQAGIEYLSVFFKKFDRVIWFDDHDSSGMLDPQIFPLVDIYAKAQILEDKNYYLKPHQIGAIHRDYVYEQHGVEDKPIFKGAVTQQDLAKLRLGWNLSLINWNYYFAGSKFSKLYHLLKSEPHKNQSPTPDLLSRNKQVIFRGRMWENEPSVGWWREETVMHNKTINDRESQPTQNPKETVSLKEYRKEIGRSIICPSPFGKGEICYRDFESFITRTLLYKPSMDHINTYPNLYIEDETYVAHQWDFCDFEEKSIDILANSGNYEHIAREGQRKFQETLSDGKGFAIQFRSFIN